MTKNELEYDRKIHTDECECWNLTKILHRRTLTVEHDRNMDEYYQKYKKIFILIKKSLRRRT